MRTYVEEVLPAPRERVLAAVNWAFNELVTPGPHENKYPKSSWLHGCYLYPLMGRDLRESNASPDPALLRYLTLPEERRRNDFYLNCRAGPSFWHSEYRSRSGVALPFTTDFIIHVDSVSPSSTRVEAIEYFPQVNAGRTFGFGYHALLPSLISDMQWVPPTTQDRLQVLDQIRLALRSM